MASKNPTPSRAALNALRGVILTTSCSVILLAEERRQRLQVAKAAINNARKLHMLKRNHGPVALTESYGFWDTTIAQLDDSVPSIASAPRSRTSTHRRSRTHLIGVDPGGDASGNYSHRAQPFTRGEGLEEFTKMGDSTTNFLRNSLHKELVPPIVNTKQPHVWRPPRTLGFRGVPSSATTLAALALEPNSIRNESDLVPVLESEQDKALDAATVAEIGSEKAARLYLNKTGRDSVPPWPYYDEAVLVLNCLISELQSASHDKSPDFDKVVLIKSIFNRLALFGRPLPKPARELQLQAIRLLQIVLLHDPEDVSSTLQTVIPISRDILKLLVPVTTILQSIGHCKSLGMVLKSLCQNPISCSWESGLLILRLLARNEKVRGGFSRTTKLYLMLQESGLFSEILVCKKTEYKIRRFMALLALNSGEDSLADAELRKLEAIDRKATLSDVFLQQYINARKLGSAKLSNVLAEFEALRQNANPNPVEFQRLFINYTDNVMETRNVQQLEAFLRKAVLDWKLQLKPRWVYAVLDGYACRREADSVFSWLHFCADHAVLMDSSFNQRFLARCCKYWSFSDKTIRRLENELLGDTRLAKATPTAVDTCAHADHGRASGDILRLEVLKLLKGNNPDFQRANDLIRSAHYEGSNVTEALTPLLMAQLAKGEDPKRLVNNALQMGVRLHNSVYNKAAQELSAGGDHGAAAEMCKIAAQENGKGQLLYNEYNFANLVFAYTGSASYEALQSVLSRFMSDMKWWHGSRTCKESIKLAMKTAAVRSVADLQNSKPHRQALEQLDYALLHVKECRYTREERRVLSEAFVRFAQVPLLKSFTKAVRLSESKVGDKEQANATAACDKVGGFGLAAASASI